MNDYRHRDRILRAWFDGCTWNRNAEFQLKRDLVTKSAALFPAFPYVVDDEWEVVPSFSDQGRGDLVFFDGQTTFAVVEVKHLDLASGPRARASRTRARKKVREQAEMYAMRLHERLRYPVLAFIYTNERREGPVRIDAVADED